MFSHEPGDIIYPQSHWGQHPVLHSVCGRAVRWVTGEIRKDPREGAQRWFLSGHNGNLADTTVTTKQLRKHWAFCSCRNASRTSGQDWQNPAGPKVRDSRCSSMSAHPAWGALAGTGSSCLLPFCRYHCHQRLGDAL